VTNADFMRYMELVNIAIEKGFRAEFVLGRLVLWLD